jgi:hypothetical protein
MLIEDQFGETTYIQNYARFNKTDLHKHFGTLYDKLDKAEQAGFRDPYVVFSSTMEPYEDYCGDVEVRIMGDREANTQELAEQAQQKYLQDLADQMGVTYYEASVIDRLQKSGKVRVDG